MYEPQYLNRWTHPKHYFGATWEEYYGSGWGRRRDSDCLEESNFHSMLKLLGGESETVLVVRENHWAVGWVEWIAIHESDDVALQKADDAKERLENYPILDESDYSEREEEECSTTWEKCYDWKDRIRYFREHSYTAKFKTLIAAVRGDWYAAGNALHCPSDLIH